MLRQTITRNVRLFSTSVRVQKSAVDAAKDAAKTVDQTVSQTIVKGIEGAGMHAMTLTTALKLQANDVTNRASRRKDQAGRWCWCKGG